MIWTYRAQKHSWLDSFLRLKGTLLHGHIAEMGPIGQVVDDAWQVFSV